MSALPLFEFKQDPNLKLAYNAYEVLLETFQKSFKRQPRCDVFVGIVGDRPNQRSCVTARWENGNDGREDAEQLLALAETVEYNLYP